jgi:hypothetical protein
MTALADSLMKMSARRVTQDLEVLRDEKRQIEAQEGLLEEILKIKQAHARNGSGPTKTPARPGYRQAIQGLLASEAGRMWSPAELRKALATKGIEISGKYLGVTLHRMVQKGDLVHAGHGAYKLAPANSGAPNLGQLDVSQSASSRASDVRTSDE